MGSANFYTFGLHSHKVRKPFDEASLPAERLEQYEEVLDAYGMQVDLYVTDDRTSALDLFVWKMMEKLIKDTLAPLGWRSECSKREPWGYLSHDRSLRSFTVCQSFTKDFLVEVKGCTFGGTAMIYLAGAYYEGFSLNLVVEAQDHRIEDNIEWEDVEYQRDALYGAAKDAIVRAANARWAGEVDAAEKEFLSLEDITKMSFASLWDAYDASTDDGKKD